MISRMPHVPHSNASLARGLVLQSPTEAYLDDYSQLRPMESCL